MATDRWISLVIAAAFCGFGWFLKPASMAFYAFAYLVGPLGIIWYSEELAAFSSNNRFDQATPGIMVKFLGWILFLITPLAVYAFKLRLEFSH